MKTPFLLLALAAILAAAGIVGLTADRWQDWARPNWAMKSAPEAPEIAVRTIEGGGPPPEDGKVAARSDQQAANPSPGLQAAPEIEPRSIEGAGPQAPADPSAVSDELQTAMQESPDPAQKQTSAEPAEDSAERKPEPDQRAAVAPEERQESTAPSAPAETKDTAAPPPAAAEPRRPSFDVVRVESGGSLVVAGTAEPGSELSLLVDGKLIGGGMANGNGEWVILPDEPLTPGSHEVVVEATDPAGSKTVSDQVVAIVVPEEPEERPLVVLTEPSRPAKVLEKPEPAKVAEKPSAAGQEVTKAPDQPEEGKSGPGKAEGGTEVGPLGRSSEKQVAVAPPAAPDALPKAEQSTEGASRQAELERQAAVSPQPEPEAMPKTGDFELQEPRLEELPGPQSGVSLSLDIVDYNDEGDIIFSGRAEPGYTVRIYIDNRFVGEAVADLEGRWSFAGHKQIAPGPHSLRADRVDQTGNVLGRIELPFFRADSNQVAALIEARRKAEARQAPRPQPALEPELEKRHAAPVPQPKGQSAEQKQGTGAAPQVSAGADQQRPSEPVRQPQQAGKADRETGQPIPQLRTAESTEDDERRPVAQPQAGIGDEQPQSAPERQAETGGERAEPAPRPQVTARLEKEPARAPGPEPAAGPPGGEKLAAAPSETGQPPSAADAEKEEAAGQVVIQPGNNLWRISRVIYGRGIQYTVIYEANREHIRDPDLIYPGQIFATPGVKPPREIDPSWRQPLPPEELEGASSE